MADRNSKKKWKKDKEKPEEDNENITDFNPDDFEAGEEVPGVKEVKDKKWHIKKDFNPDDYDEG